MRIRILSSLAALCLCAGALAAQTPLTGPAVVKITRQGDRWVMTRNGQPYFMKGGSGARSYLDELLAAGGNTIRSFGGTDMFDKAAAKGLTVMAGLRVGLPRHGFNYSDPVAVKKQQDDAVEIVRKYKDHPAILVWALGNEVELGASDADRIRVWKAIEEMAKAIKQVDQSHPVIAVLAGPGQNKLRELDQYCPSLDAIGINTYGGMMTLAETVARQGLKRPYIITEFGPRGHWEVQKTAWGLPIEDTSTEKAEFYQKAYQSGCASQPQCLGAYVFLWGDKQEKTHTWYGVFLPDGSRTGAVDAMQFAWTGKWPADRAPLIRGKIQAQGEGPEPNVFLAGGRVRVKIDLTDPEGEPQTVTWDLRKDVSDNPSTGGDREPPTPPIAGTVLSSNGTEAELKMPAEPGNYRIFTYARGKKSNAVATANLPIQVRSAGAAAVRATFGGSTTDQRWSVKQLGLPSDWSPFNYLVVEMKASSTQRFWLRLYGPQGHSSVQLHPYQGAWVRMALALDWFTKVPRQGTDMASIGNRSKPGYFVGIRGPFRPVNAIESVGLVLEDAMSNPSVEIRSIKLSKDTPGDAVLETEPLVDQFGQWTRDEWTGRARDLATLQQAWAGEERTLGKGDYGYCPYGGYSNAKAKGTGYFRVEQIDGKWWFVDPDGHLFLSTGSDVMIPWINTPVENRKNVFAAMPPERLQPPATRPDREPGISFYTWNLERRFGADWQKRWADLAFRRMDAWGLNTVANWSAPELWNAKRKPYVIPLGGWTTKTSYLGMPDVFSDEFVATVDAAAQRQCAARRSDPWLLGYFVANEPPWPGRESVVVDMILEGPDNNIQRELKKALAGGDTPEKRKAFIYRAFVRYLDVINKAVKKHDPNHLNLGIRFAGHVPDEMAEASKQFDVYSLNIYEYVPNRQYLDKIYAMTGRPLLIGEFHFGTPGRGLSAGLRQVKDYAERGIAYRYYVEQAFSMPAMIGAHWFQWIDEPVTGRFDGENYNIGFIDVTDRPYPEFVDAASETHRRLQSVHQGTTAPFDRKPAVR